MSDKIKAIKEEELENVVGGNKGRKPTGSSNDTQDPFAIRADADQIVSENGTINVINLPLAEPEMKVKAY